jgi:L-amino acid N-acyltransferase YncA
VSSRPGPTPRCYPAGSGPTASRRPTGCAPTPPRIERLPATLTIRHAQPADAAALAAIYNEGIAEREATFETRLRAPGELTAWFDGSYPVLVAELHGEIVGFAKIGSYSERAVYAGVGEHGVYVAAVARRHGAGRALLDALAEAAEAAGLYKLTSRIFSTNAASIALHVAAGFTVVGTQRRHGRLEGRWRDCVLVERLLGDAAAAD